MKKELILVSLLALMSMVNPVTLSAMEYGECVNCGYEYDTDGYCNDGSCDSDEDIDID